VANIAEGWGLGQRPKKEFLLLFRACTLAPKLAKAQSVQALSKTAVLSSGEN
jgi:hypothetical protein